jgi:hypothetical protein
MVLVPIMKLFVADIYEMSPLPPLFEAQLEMCVWTTDVHLQSIHVASYPKKYRRKKEWIRDEEN